MTDDRAHGDRGCWCSRRPRSVGSPTRRRGWPRSSPAPTWSRPRTPGGCAGWPPTSGVDDHRPGRLLLRGQRGGPHRGAGRGAARRRAGAAGDRRRHAVGVRPRLPARGGGGRARRPGHRASRARGGAHRAGGLGAAGRPVLLRGLPAAQGGGARPAARRARRRAADAWSSSRRRTAPRRPSRRWPRRSAPTAAPPSAGS